MSMRIMGTGSSNINIQPTRNRQAPKKDETTFSDVLVGSAQVLLSGAEMATSMVGGTVLSAALARTREKLSKHSAQTSGPLSSSGASGSSGSSSISSTGDSDYDAMKQLQDESKEMNTFFLQLQQKMQQENRRFTTLSNIMKSKHDTARSAINNIRS